MYNISNFRSKIDGLKGEYKSFNDRLEDLKYEYTTICEEIEYTDEAKDIVNQILIATHAQINGFIEELVTLALNIVYGDEYSFKVDNQVKRNKTETNLIIMKNGEPFSPKEEVGGGINDVCSVALRLVFYSLSQDKTDRVFILDEPIKFLSKDKHCLFSDFLNQISDMLGVQIIIVSHSNEIINNSESGFRIKQENGISNVYEE